MHFYKRHLYFSYRFYTSLKWRLGRRLTKTAFLVIGGMFVSAALGLDTSLSVAYQTFTLLFCLFLVSVVALFLNRGKFKAERIMPRFGSAHEKMSYRIIVHNQTNRIQRDLGIIDETADPRPSFRDFLETPEPGEERRNWYDRSNAWYRWQWLVSKNQQALTEEQPVATIPPQGSAEIRAELIPLRRGYLQMTDFTITCPDPFGLFRSLHEIEVSDSVLILPKRYFLPPIDLPGKLKYQQGGASMASSVGESEEFVSLREYRPGDPLRHIHWKSWAKTGKPIVKEFQDEFFVRHGLILDTFYPTIHSEVFEEAVSVAASFSYTMQMHDSLLDLLFVGPQAYCFTAGRGMAHAEQMLEILACVQICRDKPFQSLEQLVMEHLSAISGCICIMLAWDEERKNFIRQLKILGIPVLVFLVVEPGKEKEFSPGPLADEPECFRVLEVGKIEEALATMPSFSTKGATR